MVKIKYFSFDLVLLLLTLVIREMIWVGQREKKMFFSSLTSFSTNKCISFFNNFNIRRVSIWREHLTKNLFAFERSIWRIHRRLSNCRWNDAIVTLYCAVFPFFYDSSVYLYFSTVHLLSMIHLLIYYRLLISIQKGIFLVYVLKKVSDEIFYNFKFISRNNKDFFVEWISIECPQVEQNDPTIPSVFLCPKIRWKKWARNFELSFFHPKIRTVLFDMGGWWSMMTMVSKSEDFWKSGNYQ